MFKCGILINLLVLNCVLMCCTVYMVTMCSCVCWSHRTATVGDRNIAGYAVHNTINIHNCVSLVGCISHNYLGDNIEDDVMGRACGTYGGEDKYIQDFGGKT
jgi:hypothetical protein